MDSVVLPRNTIVRIELPRTVYEAIANHLRTVGRRAHRGWEVNQANEDSLTGATFSELQTRRTRHVRVDGLDWLWRVKSYKFGSGGRGSQEKRMGADGIIEIEVTHRDSGEIEHKSLLIQAKKQWTGKDSRLLDQINRMEELAPGSSAAVNYNPQGYSGVSGQDVLVAEGSRNRLQNNQIVSLGDFLADRYLACQVGVKGLYYDSRRRQLRLPPQPNAPDAIEFMIQERLRIEIEETPR